MLANLSTFFERFIKHAQKIFENILSSIFPLHCLGCDKSGAMLCPNCKHHLSPARKFEGENFHALYSYQDPAVKKMILGIKARGVKVILQSIEDDLSDLFLSVIEDELPDGNKFFLLPIPSNTKLNSERGFDPAELIAQSISKKTNLPIKHLLRRVRTTLPQVKLNRKDRLQNMSGVFEATPNFDYRGAVLCLIDDVITTGATANSARDALIKAGAKKILVFAIAH